MLHVSTQNLIRKLCDITAHGEAPWREGEDGACWFETEGYRIEVKTEPPGVRVLQAGGREVEAADAGLLASAAYPGEPGVTYADRVKRMGLEARRIARGADAAISTILSALSNPAKPETTQFSTEGGPESEAAMAAAVADMALRLQQQPLAEPAPQPEPQQASPAAFPAPAPVVAAPTRTVRTHAMFGAIPSFVRPPKPDTQAPPAPPTPAPAAPSKVTAPGLVITAIHAVTVQTPEHRSVGEPRRPSAQGYRPWS